MSADRPSLPAPADLHALVADVLMLDPEPECARYLPASFDADRLAVQLELLLRSA